MNASMDHEFAQGLRVELVRRATTAHRRRWLALGAGLTLAAGVPTAAYAVHQLRAGVNEIDVTPPVTEVHTGPGQIALGPAPEETDQVWFDLTCLDPGTVDFPGGAAVTCSAGERSSGSLPLWSGRDMLISDDGVLTVDAPADMSWQISLWYQDVVVEPFAVTGNGQTYGTPNDVYGEPDLIAAIATNGEVGYVYAEDLRLAFGPEPTSPEDAVEYTERAAGQTALVPVYEVDGETQIGEFRIG
ncbi:hypothetical protein IM660_19415 [Ruania alkalisoli]|uniref:Uncharacterized protein n=1 Tax=Ruania alkalisoli TaxID=2779775 RepID=A0A7M1ST14_9MICO|nr:hypothetical protein [Ruania alkalisoli]QOR70708.1 hypothetical protein IM660_19415 [Ruania alkalisoli]